MPVVSVISPCYNGAPYLDALSESLRAQTLTDWEHIIVDDGSTDGSAEIAARRALRDPRVRLVRQANGGVARARNAGYAAASDSTYVYFLDVDDVLESDMLRVMVDYLDAHPSVGLAYCAYTPIDASGRPLPDDPIPRYVKSWFGVRELRPDEPQTPLLSIYCWAPVMESLSVLRRSVYDQTDGWDPALGQGGEGVDLFLQVAFLSEAHFVNQRLYRYRRHVAQASQTADRHTRQDLKVQMKWRDRAGVPSRLRALVDDAQAFRMGRLRAYLQLVAAGRYIRRGELRHAASCAVDIVRTAVPVLLGKSPWPAGAAS